MDDLEPRPICPKCGTMNPAGAEACSYCRALLKAPAEPAAAPPAPAAAPVPAEAQPTRSPALSALLGAFFMLCLQCLPQLMFHTYDINALNYPAAALIGYAAGFLIASRPLFRRGLLAGLAGGALTGLTPIVLDPKMSGGLGPLVIGFFSILYSILGLACGAIMVLVFRGRRGGGARIGNGAVALITAGLNFAGGVFMLVVSENPKWRDGPNPEPATIAILALLTGGLGALSLFLALGFHRGAGDPEKDKAKETAIIAGALNMLTGGAVIYATYAAALTGGVILILLIVSAHVAGAAMYLRGRK